MAVSQSLTLTEVSIDPSNNQSKVRIVWKSTQTGESYNNNQKVARVTIKDSNGKVEEFAVYYTLPKNSTITILDTIRTVDHSKTDDMSYVQVSTWMHTGISAGEVEQTKTLFLDTMPRITSINKLSCGEHNSDGTRTLTITYTPPSEYIFNVCRITTSNGTSSSSKVVNLGKKSTQQQTDTVTFSSGEIDTLYRMFTNTDRCKLDVRIDTYSDAEATILLGTGNTVPLNIIIPNIPATQPTAKLAVSPVSDLPSPFNTLYIKGKTKLETNITNGQGKYGASITSYLLSIDGKRWNPPYTTSYLAKSGDVVVTGTVTDSRGFSKTYTNTITVLDYAPPRIVHISSESEVIATRCDSSGNLSETGTYLKIKAKRSYSKVDSGGQKNFCEIRYRYKKEGGSYPDAWTTILADTATSDEVVTGALLGTLSVESSYFVQIQVIDTIGDTGTTTIIVPTERVYMHRAGSLNALGIGKYAEEANTVDIADAIAVKIRGNAKIFGEADLEGGAKIQGDAIVDFIVEEGTKDIWTYRKWHSGIAECWGRNIVTVDITTQTTESLYRVQIGAIAFPFAFKAAPSCQVTVETSNGAWSACNVRALAGFTPAVMLYRYGSITAQQCDVLYYAIGRWK